MKYIVHEGTGTVIAVDECVIVDVPEEVLTTLDGDDYFDEYKICEYASENGKPINTTDLTWSNTVAYSPFAIREEIRESLWEGYSDDDEERAVLEWAEKATDDELNQIAEYILSANDSWGEYTSNMMDGLREGYRRAKEGK
jgi:hypothetical protein